MKPHIGEFKIANPAFLPVGFQVNFLLCWCGARWFGPPLVDVELWCPMAPAGSTPPQPTNVLTIGVTEPDWAVDTPMPYVIGAQVGGVGTTLAASNNEGRALLIGHALWETYAGKAEQFRQAWR